MQAEAWLSPFLIIRALTLWLVVAALAVGCGTSLQYVQNGPETYQPRGEPASVQVFHADPDQPFQVLGFINWDYYQPGVRAPNLTDVLPQLKRRAWEAGGDAIIIRKQDVGVAPAARNLRIIADVIRFRR